MLHQLLVLGIDTVPVLVKADLGDFEHRDRLIQIGFGLEEANLLGLFLVLIGRRVELADDIAGLDLGTFGKDFHDAGRARLFLIKHGGSATSAASTASTATTPAAHAAWFCFLVAVASAAFGVTGRSGVWATTVYEKLRITGLEDAVVVPPDPLEEEPEPIDERSSPTMRMSRSRKNPSWRLMN